MRRYFVLALVALAAGLLVVSSAASKPTANDTIYLVAYAEGTSAADGRAAIKRLGGTILREDAALGYAKVSTQNANFLKGVRDSSVLAGAARDRVIATTEPGLRPKDYDIERMPAERQATLGQGGVNDAAPSATGEPLAAHWQWDMRMIQATSTESYATEPGKKGVLVGVMDTGIDASHPDIAPNFNAALSRNFTVDDELIDGKCSQEPDHSCTDPATVDEDGHGTHVAGTIASPINGFGMAGVAPGVTLVNIRAGQDSGFFFLEPTLQAMEYAGNVGIDVVNMSFYTDPWLYNCGPDHPATDPVTGAPVDSPEDQLEQQTIIDLSQRAIDYARSRGVTFIGAAGNEHTNLGNPTFDDTSPDYPPGTAYARVVTNFCTDVPTELKGVVSVSALGPTKAKADYSNYGVEQIEVSAPGGYFRDGFGTPLFRTPETQILGPYPTEIAKAAHEIDASGKVRSPFVVRDCDANGNCAYYQLIQGTSMASPHAAGVAALIVSKYGKADKDHPGLTMNPNAVADKLRETASEQACPVPATVDYTIVGRPASWNATCTGTNAFNDFYGHGIVNALAAVTG
jgi:lantibiotic leader peptide-processing serine protease